MKTFRTGIVVGKFAPLHKGHEFLINAALAQCEKVVVVSYCLPEIADCAAEKRRRWLEVLFQQVKLIIVTRDEVELWRSSGDWALPMPENNATNDLHQQFTLALLQRYSIPPIDAVFSSEHYGRGFADYLSNAYTSLGIAHHNVAAVDVDIDRSTMPISGSRIRNDIYGHRQWLSPVVYRDFIKTVCFLGGESTGKTTLARAMAERLHTRWVPEFGRERWLAKQGQLDWQDYIDIAATQIEREDQARLDSRKWLFCDTSPLTTLLYCLHQFNDAPAQLIAAANRHYDYIFLCLPDFKFVQDGTRRDDSFRLHQHQWYTNTLMTMSLQSTVLSGPFNLRVAQVFASLNI